MKKIYIKPEFKEIHVDVSEALLIASGPEDGGIGGIGDDNSAKGTIFETGDNIFDIDDNSLDFGGDDSLF